MNCAMYRSTAVELANPPPSPFEKKAHHHGAADAGGVPKAAKQTNRMANRQMAYKLRRHDRSPRACRITPQLFWLPTLFNTSEFIMLYKKMSRGDQYGRSPTYK